MKKATQGGFTLVELVVVIVILGILAAFALPKFMGLETQARVASLRALEGTLRSSAAMAHSVWMVNGGATVQIENVPVAIANGYPTRASVALTLQNGSVDTAGVVTPGRFTYTPGNGQFRLNGAPNSAQCLVTYTNAVAGASPTIVVSNIAGC